MDDEVEGEVVAAAEGGTGTGWEGRKRTWTRRRTRPSWRRGKHSELALRSQVQHGCGGGAAARVNFFFHAVVGTCGLAFFLLGPLAVAVVGFVGCPVPVIPNVLDASYMVHETPMCVLGRSSVCFVMALFNNGLAQWGSRLVLSSKQ